MTPKQTIETQEFIAAVGVAVIRVKSFLPKVSWFEVLTLLKDWDIFKKGIDGIQNIPHEILDLSPEETKQIIDQIGVYLVELKIPYNRIDITNDIIDIALDLIRVIQRMVNPIPVPQIVP